MRGPRDGVWARGGASRYNPGDCCFQEEDQPTRAAAVYDAVIAMGMAACRARQLEPTYKARKRPPRTRVFPFTNRESQLCNEITIKTTFMGASGEVRLHDGMFHVRPAETLTFGVHNFRAASVLGNGTGTAYEASLASIQRPGRNWTDVGEFLPSLATPPSCI